MAPGDVSDCMETLYFHQFETIRGSCGRCETDLADTNPKRQ
jgi:hypothetical protein